MSPMARYYRANSRCRNGLGAYQRLPRPTGIPEAVATAFLPRRHSC
ncbi:uncharacterized protein FFB20_11100 [Fusarium fujikuroi]|nr:uncharacterized protein FFC1_02889 [Fusarium fujikuroi]SCN85949.1 uncharacterized protein FFE2_05822 [Fusarium fujikuroi]SCN92187.1 uncharacterized protein FFM5_05270 [Fusarium fujikuroi]SCO00183.1 uncharacterized protein FFB20_11100 [Fusarium fujikuroi]SCO31653.1 uncharacterized protein FFNC_02345 [Fusarium fujikuroi]